MRLFPSKADCRHDIVARVGFWILAGVFAAVVAAWAVWWRITNEPKVHLTLFFRGSVHGIDIGSPVKINGVHVGQIETMGVRIPTKRSPDYYAEVRVVMDGDLLASKGLPRDLENHDYLADEIRRGLRGRLRLISPMTGDMYLELEYSPSEPAVLVADAKERVPEIPTLNDPLSTGIIGLTHRLAEMEKKDFAAISRELKERLDLVAAATAPGAFTDVSEDAKRRLADMRTALDDPDLRQKVADVAAGLVKVREALARYDAGTADGGKDLGAVMEKLRADLVKASESAEKLGHRMDPRSPALLVTYARFALLKDNVERIRRLCDEIVEADSYAAALFRAASTAPADSTGR